MLGTEAGRQQSGMWRLWLLRQALAGNPPGPLEHCVIPACIQAPTGELLIAPQYPQHFPIRSPLSFLGAEVAQRGLALGKLVERTGGPFIHAGTQQRVNDEGRIPKPEALVGIGAGIDRKSTRLISSHVKISYAVF